MIALGRGHFAEQQLRPRMRRIDPRRLLEFAPGHLEARLGIAGQRARCEFAAKVRNVACAVFAAVALQPLGQFDRQRPVAHHLRDFEPVVQRRGPVARALQAVERVFGAIEQTRLQVVLAELEQRVLALRRVEVTTLDQVQVHADRPVGLAAAPKQVAQRVVQVDRFGIEPDDVDERVDRLVGLLVEQEIQPSEIRVGQAAAVAATPVVPECGLVARREPPEHEEQRYRQQPPGLELEHGPDQTPRPTEEPEAVCATDGGGGVACP